MSANPVAAFRLAELLKDYDDPAVRDLAAATIDLAKLLLVAQEIHGPGWAEWVLAFLGPLSAQDFHKLIGDPE